MSAFTFSNVFSDWLNYHLTWYPWASYDKYGEPAYGKSSTIHCYMEASPKLCRDAKGQQVVSSARFYCAGNSSFNVLDKFVQPSGTYGVTIRIDHFYDEEGDLEMSVIYV